MTATENEIYEKMRDLLAEALAIEPEEVLPEARLSDDLGAESLDYLDIAFRMEKTFGITVKPNEMLMGDGFDERYVIDGKISDAGLEELQRRLPHVDLGRLRQTRDIKDFRGVFTVESLVRFIESRLDAGRRQAQAHSA